MFRDSALRLVRAQRRATRDGFPLASRPDLVRVLRENRIVTLATKSPAAVPPELKPQLAHADHSTLLIAYLDALIDAKHGDPHAHEIADALHAMLHGENVGWRKHAPVTMLSLGPHKFSSTQIQVPSPISYELVQFANSIPDDYLAEDGREDEPHITVKYGLHTNDADAVYEAVKGFGPIHVQLGKISLFEVPEKHDVVKIDVVSSDLHRLNRIISDSTECTDTYPDYKPHLTIAYVHAGLGKRYLGRNSLEGVEFTVRDLTFSSKDGERYTIHLDVPTTLALPHLPAIQQAHATIKAHPQILKQAQQRESQQQAVAAEQEASRKAAEKEQQKQQRAVEKAATRPGTAANPLQLPSKDRPLPKPPPMAKPVPLGNQRVVGAMRSNLKHPKFNPFHPHHEEALHDLHGAIREHKTSGTAESEANLKAAKEHFAETTGHPDASALDRPDIGLRVGAVSSGLRNARHMGMPGTASHDYATETVAEHGQQAGLYRSYGRHQAQPAEGPEAEAEAPTVQSTTANPVPPPPPPGGFKQGQAWQQTGQQQPGQPGQPGQQPGQPRQSATQQAVPQQVSPQQHSQQQPGQPGQTGPIKLEPGKPNPFTGRVIRHPNAHWDSATNSVIYPTGGTEQQPQPQATTPTPAAEPPENPHAAALAQKIVAHHQNPNAPPPTTEDYKQFAEHAATMPTQQQVNVRNEVLGSVDNPQMKEQMANALRHGLAAKFEHGAAQQESPKEQENAANAAPGHPAGPAIAGTPPSGQIQPGRAYNVPTSSLHVDPDRFQYKLHMGTGGVGETLKGVKYNPTFGGILLVWRDPADGKDYVINGHHRYELAARSQHPDLNVQYIDAKTPIEARSVGALANIAEGHGTALDAAKFLRGSGLTAEEMKEKHQISLKGKVAADAAILSKLSDPLFHKVTVGQLDEDRAKAIAEHLAADPSGQAALLGYIEQQETDRGRDIPPKVVEQLAREWAAAPKTENDQPDLFGEAEDRSTFLDRAVLKTRLRADLTKRLNDFLAVSSKRRETAVRGAGNKIEVEKNQESADEAKNLLDTFDRLSPYKGELQDILNEEGLKYANARNQKFRDIVATNAGMRIRNFLRQAGSAVQTDRGAEGANRSTGVQTGGGPESVPQGTDRGSAADGGGSGTAGAGRVGVDYASLSKEQMKELAKTMPVPDSLPENHASYFKHVEGAKTVPLDKIRNLRARPEGIENAAKFMEISRRGGPKREPIKVVEEPDRTYTVADGNSTFANAKKSGWSSLPVQVVSREWMRDEQKKTIDKEHAKAVRNLAHEKLFTPDEMNLGKQASNQQASREAISAAAPQVKREYDNALNTGKGLDLALGASVFDPAKLPGSMTRAQKYQAYIEAFKRPGPVVLLAPLKNLEGRAQEKVDADLNGDWSRLHDVVRGTVGVDSLHDIPGAIAKLKEEMDRRGFTLVKTPKNRFGGKPTVEGYRDLNLSFAAPNGLVTEVQVNAKPMLIAKEEGHKYYEISRSVVAGAKMAGRDELTEDEARRVSEAIGKQRDIYTEGYLRSLGVHEEGNSELVAHAREQLEKQYNEDWQSDLQEMGLKNGITKSVPRNPKLPDLHGNGRIPAESGRSAPIAEAPEQAGAMGDRGRQSLHAGRRSDLESGIRPDGGRRTTLATSHAPAGGSDADGKHFEGGQFVPGESSQSGEQSSNGQDGSQPPASAPAPPPEDDLSEHPEGEMPAVRALKGLWEHARESGSVAIIDDATEILSQFSTAALYDAIEEFGHPECRDIGRGNLLKRIFGWLDWMATTTHKPEAGQPAFYDTHYNPPYPQGQPTHPKGTQQNPLPLSSEITPHQVAAACDELQDVLAIIGIRPNPSTTRERLVKQIHDMIDARRE